MDATTRPAPQPDLKATLHHYLSSARTTLLWKLDGLSEAQVRRPMTPTATNLLGIVKHLAGIEYGYFGQVFGEPVPHLPWMDVDAPDNADMVATAEESRAQIMDLYREAIAASDRLIEASALDRPAHVPWWGDRADTTLGFLLVHMVAETQRHLGQADIVRELIDGSTGLRASVSNLPDRDEAWWASYYDTVAQLASAHEDHATGDQSS